MNHTVNTIEDFERIFTNENVCRKFLESVRWPDGPVCPFCGGTHVYTLAKKTPKGEEFNGYKCGTKGCYYKFHIASKSLLASTKIPFQEWLWWSFLYCESRGRKTCGNTKNDLTWLTKCVIDEKITSMYESVRKQGRTNNEIFREATSNFFNPEILSKLGTARNIRHKRFEDDELIDISNVKDYNRVVALIKKILYNGIIRKYYVGVFCDPEEVLAEAYLSLDETQCRVPIEGRHIFEMMTKTIYRMHKAYLEQERPDYIEWKKQYGYAWRVQNRRSININYIIEIIQERHRSNPNSWGTITAKEIRQNRALVEETRNRIIAHRAKRRIIYI